MREDRLRRDAAEIHNVDDIIKARAGNTSHLTEDVDSLEDDVLIPEDIDVDEALTFPHPKHKHREIDDIELMDTPDEKNTEDEWANQDIQPTDYEHSYDEGTNAHASDDPDVEIEEAIHHIGQVEAEDVSEEPSMGVMGTRFIPDEETGEW